MKWLIAAFAAVLLASCATDGVPSVSSGGTSGVTSALRTADEKALIGVEASYRAVLLAVNAAVDSGALKGANAQKVSDLLTKARAGVTAARGAYDAGNSVQLALRVGEASSALASVRALIGR